MASLLAGRGLTVLLLLISIVLVYLAGVNLDGGQQVNVTSSKEVLPLSPNVAVANVTVTKVAVPFGDLRLDHLAQPEGSVYDEVPVLGRTKRRLHKRVFTLEAARIAGQVSLDRLSNPRSQSPWSEVQQLRNAGWELPDTQTDDTNYYDDAYKQYGINRAYGVERDATQVRNFDNCRHKDNPGTDGEYRNTFNVRGRAIVARDNYSPSYQLKMKERDEGKAADGIPWRERLPDVSPWSEVVWILWLDQVARELGFLADFGDLKYVFRHHIITDETMDVINALAPNPDDVPDPYDERNPPFKAEWPGVVFAKGTDGFKALLGTPHGNGVSFLIAKHPKYMPGKDIESARIFCTRNDFGFYHANILFTLTG